MEMKLWEYLDRRNERRYAKKQLRHYRKEYKEHCAIVEWVKTRPDLIKMYSNMSAEIRGKIKYWENKLKELYSGNK